MPRSTFAKPFPKRIGSPVGLLLATDAAGGEAVVVGAGSQILLNTFPDCAATPTLPLERSMGVLPDCANHGFTTSDRKLAGRQVLFCSLECIFDSGKSVLLILRRFDGGTPALESGGLRKRENDSGYPTRSSQTMLNVPGAPSALFLSALMGSNSPVMLPIYTRTRSLSVFIPLYLYFAGFLRYILAGRTIAKAY